VKLEYAECVFIDRPPAVSDNVPKVFFLKVAYLRNYATVKAFGPNIKGRTLQMLTLFVKHRSAMYEVFTFIFALKHKF
jgi:hypothetical protein